MARYTEPACKICRREGLKLLFKGVRCLTDKCAFERRSYAPGQSGQRRTKITEYALQLREKQKVKRYYGLMEKQFKLTFRRAERIKGLPGVNLLILLERRLDNLVCRSGIAESRRQARQLVTHGMFAVNGTPTNIPSYTLKEGDSITLLAKSGDVAVIKKGLESAESRALPDWLAFDKENVVWKVTSMPDRESIPLPIQEQLIVELYSR